MMFCMLLVAPWLFLSRVDAGASPGPPVTLNNTPDSPTRPLPTQPPPPITQYAPPINALVPLDKRGYIPHESAAKPALGCTYTKRVPRPRTTNLENPNNNPNQPTETLTSYINCRGCTTATAITVPHIPARAAGPAWRFPLPWPNPTPPLPAAQRLSTSVSRGPKWRRPRHPQYGRQALGGRGRWRRRLLIHDDMSGCNYNAGINQSRIKYQWQAFSQSHPTRRSRSGY